MLDTSLLAPLRVNMPTSTLLPFVFCIGISNFRACYVPAQASSQMNVAPMQHVEQ